MELQTLSRGRGRLGEPPLHSTALRENKGSALMQRGSAACFSEEQGGEMARWTCSYRQRAGRWGPSSKPNAK